MPRLVLDFQGHTNEFEVAQLTTIGRQATNDIMVLADKASRQHARIVASGANFIIEDLGSSNGTLVNEVRIQRHPLKDGDVIRIGNATLTFQDEARSPNLEGEVLGNYRIHNKIGEGAMGAVYKATQISMDRIVALKILKVELTRDHDFVRAFLNEARTAGKLNHPNVVRVHDFGEAGGVYYFSMEYVNGENMEAVLEREGKLSAERALDVARQTAQALEHAHGIGVFHRDIKPQNILVDRRGQVKLTDLGLAKATRSDPETRKKSIMGTPHYMPPETAEHRHFDQRSDIYSLGATLFHLITGRVPYDGANSLAVIAKHVNDPVPSARKLDPAIPEPVSRLVELMMSKNPSLRPASARELIRGLDEASEKMKKAPAAGARQSSVEDPGLAPIPLDRPAPARTSSPRPSSPRPAPARTKTPVVPFPAAPGGPRPVRVVEVGGGSPVLYMMIGALVVAILAVVGWIVYKGKAPPARNGGGRVIGSGGGAAPSASGAMTGAESRRKMDEAERAFRDGDNARARSLAEEVRDRSPEIREVGRAWDLLGKIEEKEGTSPRGGVISASTEREAASELAAVKANLDANPESKPLAARQLIRIVQQYRGTRAASDAADLVRRLFGSDLPPEIEVMLKRSSRPAPGKRAAPKEPPGDILRKACDASYEAFRSEDYHQACAVLRQAIEDLEGTPEATDAAEELDRRETSIRERLARIYGQALVLGNRQRFGEAAKKLREIISKDPIGKDRVLAEKLLAENEAKARDVHAKVLASARPHIERCAFGRAERALKIGSPRLEGTKWQASLEQTLRSVTLAKGLIDRFAKKVAASGGKLDATLDLKGKATTGKLVRAGPTGVTLGRRGIETALPWRDISANDVFKTFGLFPLAPADRVGLGALFLLRGEEQVARPVLEEARKDPAVRADALFLLAQLDRSQDISRIDFSSYEQSDELELTGAWSIRDGMLHHDDSEVGTVTLKNREYGADGLQLSFEVTFLEDQGAIEVQLGAASDACVWFNLGSAGYQARVTTPRGAAGGGRTAEVEDPWIIRANEAQAVSCRIAGDALSVTADGKAMKKLELPGLGELEGPLTFRAQGARLALDNIVARQK